MGKLEKRRFICCIACKQRVPIKTRRKVNCSIKVYLADVLKIKDVKENDVICNKCKHRFYTYKNKPDPLNHHTETPLCDSESGESDPTFSPIQRPVFSPPSISLRIPGISNSHSRCFICKRPGPKLVIISADARMKAFIEKNIFIAVGARCCTQHIDFSSDYIKSNDLDSISTTETCSSNRSNLLKFLGQLRNTCQQSYMNTLNFDSMDDVTCKSLTGFSYHEFNDICMHIQSHVKKTCTRTPKNSIGIFLFKLKSAISNSLLSTILHISRHSIRRAISSVRQALLKYFVPFYLGFESITRAEVITKHTTQLSKSLFNAEDEMILVLDGTYIYVQKSNNFSFQRLSYSMHKSRCLVKPMVIVSTTGYFIDILGPYVAKNNDASILNHIMNRNIKDIKDFVLERDIFVVDRGFRDSLDLLEEMGIQASMPKFMKKGDKQMADLDANQSRMVTKIRWVVESANARIKRFKYLERVLPTNQIPFIGDYIRIVCALSNRYFPPLNRTTASDADLAQTMKQRCNEINSLKSYIEDNSLDRRPSKWVEIDDITLNFPKMTETQLRNITLGTYQLKLCPSYIQEYIEGESKIFIHRENSNLVRVKIQSRHVSSKQYQLWLKYNNEEVTGWYCKCRAGARVVGVCAHIAAVIFYLSQDRSDDTVGVKDWSKYVDDVSNFPDTIDLSDSDTDSNDSVIEE